MPKVVTIVLGGRAAVATQRAHLERGALFVPSPDPEPDPMMELTARVEVGDKHVELAARVIQIVPNGGIALALDDIDDARRQLDRVFEASEDGDEDAATEVTWGRPIRRPTTDDDTTASIHHRIHMMTTAEKRHLAAHGDRPARTILMRDINKTLHVFVIQNPKITLDEVRAMAGYAQCNPDALKRIAQNREWVQNHRIVSALVRNPKTPTTLAIRLLDKLPFSELRAISKSTSVSRSVQQAARKKVTR